MRRHHPGHDLPRIAFDNTDTIDPAALELDEVANIREPQVMAVRWAIGEMFKAGHVGLRIAGTLPGPRAPWNWRLMAIARPTVLSLGGGSSRCCPSKPWMRNRPARGYAC